MTSAQATPGIDAQRSPTALPTLPPPLREGIPTLVEVDDMLRGDLWREVAGFNAAFLERHKTALSGYAWHWGRDPLKFWSRRWEYPFAIRATLAHAHRLGRTDLKICDAGSGVTFFPYFLADRLPESRISCCDYAATYAPIFAAVNRNESHDRVSFTRASMQDMPYADAELDVLACISVLEHTGEYEKIVREVARVLKPGGRFVLTFDLSQDDVFEMQPPQARRMFDVLQELFDVSAPALQAEAQRAQDEPDNLLCTPTIRRVQPELLPWKWPRLQSLADFLRGYGFTGGFRAAACYCLDAPRR
jgi:SAM-dependent methyltransferase